MMEVRSSGRCHLQTLEQEASESVPLNKLVLCHNAIWNEEGGLLKKCSVSPKQGENYVALYKNRA
jgi:hypothetical protein